MLEYELEICIITFIIGAGKSAESETSVMCNSQLKDILFNIIKVIINIKIIKITLPCKALKKDDVLFNFKTGFWNI